MSSIQKSWKDSTVKTIIPITWIHQVQAFCHISLYYLSLVGLPGCSDGKEPTCNVGSPRFDPWVRKITWRRERQPTSVFLLGEFHGQRSQVGYNPWGCDESDRTERLTLTYVSLGVFFYEHVAKSWQNVRSKRVAQQVALKGEDNVQWLRCSSRTLLSSLHTIGMHILPLFSPVSAVFHYRLSQSCA